MMKKFKLSICFILTLIFLFTFVSAGAFASDSKTVSITTTKSFTCTGPEIGSNIASIQSSTYYYDDGAYKGVLSYYQINNVNVVNSGSYYQVTVTVTYSGTVTSYTPPVTKSVSVTVDRSFTCEGPQINANMLAIQNSTYYYDDGAFRGTLNYVNLTVVSVTTVGQGSTGSILQFSLKVDYSGTVTSY